MSLALVAALDPSVVIVTLPPGLTPEKFQRKERRERELDQLLEYPRSPTHPLTCY